MSLNIASLLFERSERDAERAAVLTRSSETSYSSLRHRASAVAGRLTEEGLKPGTHIAILMERSADAIAALFGVYSAGMVAVVINERLRQRQIDYQLASSGARAIVINEGTSRSWTPSGDAVRAVAMESLDASAHDVVPVELPARSMAQIIYTSGSTGMPKGVVFTHDALLAGVTSVNRYLRQNRDDRVASALSLSTVYGLNQILTSLACGAALVIETSPLAMELLATFRKRSATVFAAVPPLWQQILRGEDFSAVAMKSLRILQCAGGRLPTPSVREARRRFPAAELFLQYGQTETFRSSYVPPDQVDARYETIGIAVPGTELFVLREDGSVASDGELGELVHAGPSIANGYWNEPEATARVFRPHPDQGAASRGERAVFTGDLARRDSDGYLTLVSRRDQLIKSMGFRVGPDEIASVLLASGDVTDAAVTSLPHAERGEEIIAFVVLAPQGDLKRLQKFCRSELPPYMLPGRFEVLERLPLLPGGKYDLRALRNTYLGIVDLP